MRFGSVLQTVSHIKQPQSDVAKMRVATIVHSCAKHLDSVKSFKHYFVIVRSYVSVMACSVYQHPATKCSS